MCLQSASPGVKSPRVTLTLALLGAGAAGAALAWLFLQGRQAGLAERIRARDEQNSRLSADLATEKLSRAESEGRANRLAAELSGEKSGAEARLSELRFAHDRLKGEFAELSAAALRANRDDFLKLAELEFSKLQQQSAGDLTARQGAIDALVKPLRESLDKVDGKIVELEQRRERAYGDLSRLLETLSTTQLRLQAETSRLATSLSTTRTAGTWGEVQLRRVVELSGMTEHCDFAEQVTPGSGERDRADLVVSLPGGQKIVVDAKAPTDAYREAASEPDPERRAARFKEHATRVRAHVDALSAREYWAKFQPSPEFVILFLPGDQFLSAALEADPGLMDRAINNRVLLATPATLVALLKAAAYGWRQEDVSKGTAEIAELGRQLHDRLGTFGDHMERAGRSLEGAVKHYNAAVGSLEGSVLPGARRFAELGAKGSKEIPSLAPIDTTVREVASREAANGEAARKG